MAIGTGAAVEFFGTQTTLDSTSSSVASETYSVSADQTSFTNTLDSTYGSLVITFTYSVAPIAGELVILYMRRVNVDGTDDEPTPSDDAQGSVVDAVSIDAVTTLQVRVATVQLENVETAQEYEFYLKNGSTTQTISSGWTAKITQKAIGPAA